MISVVSFNATVVESCKDCATFGISASPVLQISLSTFLTATCSRDAFAVVLMALCSFPSCKQCGTTGIDHISFYIHIMFIFIIQNILYDLIVG